MLRKWLIKMASPENKSSISGKLRHKRFILFKNILPNTVDPVKILDVGGKETIWSREGYCNSNTINQFQITILNINQQKTTANNIRSVVGDARNMSEFADNEFDIVFSNSVIEHVGNYEDKIQMAKEIKRVGQKYFVQTPNFYFPIEPHFVYPFFQFLPFAIKVWILTNIGRRYRKVGSQEKAKTIIQGINLLTRTKIVQLFPEATIFEEKFFGLTKSFIAYQK